MIRLKSFADLTHADVERILAVVDRLNDVEIHLEVDGMKLHVRKFSDASLAVASSFPVAPPAAPPAARSVAVQASMAPVAAPVVLPVAAVPPGLVEIRAPMLGRFFRASSPSEPVYVEVGTRVGPHETVCMIEVMKLFNTVEAGVSGTIVEVLVENGSMVEHDAVLFRVKPE